MPPLIPAARLMDQPTPFFPRPLTAGPVRPLTIAVIPPVTSLGALPAATVQAHLSFLHAPPPKPSPGRNSILRI
jgi:hypothetical protein